MLKDKGVIKLKSKDIMQQELNDKFNKAMQSNDPNALTRVLADYAQEIKEEVKEVNMSAINEVNQKNNKRQFEKEIGIKASKMNSEEFREKFGGKRDIKFSDFSQIVLNTGNHEKLRDEYKIKQMTDGSIIAPVGVSADIIYSACQKSVLLSNSTIIPMKTGTLITGRMKENMPLDFKKRGEKGQETSLQLEPVTLESKTLYGYVEVPEEDIQDVYEIEHIIRNAFANAVAMALDNNFLYTNSNAISNEEDSTKYPRGILDNSKINKVTVDSCDFDMIAKARLMIVKKDGAPDTIGINPEELFTIETLKDTTGQYLQAPEFYKNLNIVESNALKVKDAIVMDSNAVVIGIRDDINIKIMNDTTKGTVIIRCMVRADVVPVREDHICKITINQV